MNDIEYIERSLPHSLEAERAVLGSIFLGSPSVREVVMQLEASDFFLPEHRIIYRHMRRVVEQGKPPDSVLALESLLTNGDIEAAGGAGYISQIPDGMARVNDLPFCVGILKEKAQLRQRAYTAQKIQQMALGAHGNAAEVLKEIGILSAQLREEVGQKRILKFRSGIEVAMTTGEQIEWIVPGFVAKGAVTELGGKSQSRQNDANYEPRECRCGRTRLPWQTHNEDADRISDRAAHCFVPTSNGSSGPSRTARLPLFAAHRHWRNDLAGGGCSRCPRAQARWRDAVSS